MAEKIVNFSINKPKLIIGIFILVTLFFCLQFPKVKIDTDPKNMLPATSPVRVHNAKIEKLFELHPDVIVLGIVSKKGILRKDTLNKISKITDEILNLDGVISRDVISFTTVDNVVASDDLISVSPLLDKIPEKKYELENFRKFLFGNKMFLEKLISKDGKTTSIYIPIEATANGKEIADRIKKITSLQKGDEEYYLAGDPVSRDTFGAVMFKQMAMFSPIAGMIMCIALFLMFRDFKLVFLNMAFAMISIIWSMGALIGLSFTVHIMSSMIPVFLMAISTDSVHIFSEFYFRYKEVKEKKPAILDTMKTVGSSIFYTDLTTAAAFASLSAGGIIPVRVFGIFVAVGTIVILLMSFTLIPAILILLNEEKLNKIILKKEEESGSSKWLFSLGKIGVHKSKAIVLIGTLSFLISIFGISKININNNMVRWFKKGSEIRRADEILNKNLGGTSSGYIVATTDRADYFKAPDVLRYIEKLQKHIEKNPLVGKTTSVVDVVKRINRVIHKDDESYEAIPDKREIISEYLLLFSMSAKQSTLNNLIDYPYQNANILVQLKTWDADAYRNVIEDSKKFLKLHPMKNIKLEPAGIAHFNMVWNDEVLKDMLKGFIISLILVFFILIIGFRSILWGIISFVPLIFTIFLIYGVIGIIGKDFDMPISVLSTLSLGLATDFAVHYIRRFNLKFKIDKNVENSLLWTNTRPGRGIIRNAVLFAFSFSSMCFASLTPYITVGIFMAAIMILSSITTLIFLPALIIIFKNKLLKEG